MSGCKKIRFEYDGSVWEQGIRCGVKKYNSTTRRWQYYKGDQIPIEVSKHFEKMEFEPVMVLLTGGNTGHRWKHQKFDNKQKVEDYLRKKYNGLITFPKRKSAFTYVLSPDGAREKSATAKKLAGEAEIVTLKKLEIYMNMDIDSNMKHEKEFAPIPVLLSGGSERARWNKQGFDNKKAVENHFSERYPNLITFPKSFPKSIPENKKILWVLMPDGVAEPSASANKKAGLTAGLMTVKELTNYMDDVKVAQNR
jgi:hypothetical protein